MIRSSKVRFFALSATVAATLLVPGPAQASATIDVPCGDVAALRAAIVTSNTDSEPQNTINLAAGCTYRIIDPYAEGEFDGLPPITHNIDIQGHGATLTKSSADEGNGFRILRIDDGTVALFDIGISRGFVSGGGGFALDGAGILNRSVLFINGATFFGNEVRAGVGGAIYNDGYLSANDVTFRSNLASGILGQLQAAGAIYNALDARAEIRWSNFVSNEATVGGAIVNSGDVMILESAFDSNGDGRFHGAISNGGTATILQSYFEFNRAGSEGGAIGNDAGASLDIVNTTFRGNQAINPNDSTDLRDGGAIHNAGTLTGSHVTFSSNRAHAGAAIFNDDETGSATVVNSIFNSDNRDCAGTISDGGYNLVWPADSTCPASFVRGDPKLAPVSQNGAEQAFNLSHRLGPGSAAIDNVPPEGCVWGIDQRGFRRRQGDGCDSGSYENQVPTMPGTPIVGVGANPNNSGEFRLDWDPVLDPDVGDTITYRLFHRDADDPEASLVVATTATQHAFISGSPESEGTFEYWVEASDGNHSSGPSGLSAPVVVDKTAPDAPQIFADRPPDYQPDGDNGWYRSPVFVTITADDPALDDGSPGSGIASVTPSQTLDTSGAHLVTGTATDNAGNISPSGALDVLVDGDDPAVAFTSCPGDVLLGVAASAEWQASDAHSGLASIPGGSIALDTSEVGSKSVTTPVALDNVGHTATATCEYRVIYDFNGFFAPIKDLPAYNSASAGRIVPMSFSLAGDQGLAVIAPEYPQSAPITCGSEDKLDQGAATETSARGFTYVPTGDGRYTYFWKTLAEWSGTCRQFIMKLDDGTFHRANFQF